MDDIFSLSKEVWVSFVSLGTAAQEVACDSWLSGALSLSSTVLCYDDVGIRWWVSRHLEEGARHAFGCEWIEWWYNSEVHSAYWRCRVYDPQDVFSYQHVWLAGNCQHDSVWHDPRGWLSYCNRYWVVTSNWYFDHLQQLWYASIILV